MYNIYMRLFSFLLYTRVFVVFQGTEGAKGNKGSEVLQEQLGFREEQLESEDQRDLQAQPVSQASRVYPVFLGELGNSGRLGDQEKRWNRTMPEKTIIMYWVC